VPGELTPGVISGQTTSEESCRESQEWALARSELSLEELVEAFAHHGAAQTDAIFRGDARTGNKHARMRYATFDKLRARGDVGRDALAVLFKHPRMDVRAMAAAYLLRHRSEEARAVLVEISKGEGFAAFMASEALKRWEEGVWALDLAEVPAGEGGNGPDNPASRGSSGKR